MPFPSFGVLARAAFSTLRISVPTIIDGMRNRVDPRTCDARLDGWSRKLLAQVGVQLETSGLQHVTPGTSYLVMSNHQSYYDIPVLFQALKLPMRMVAKTELFQVPVWGQAMRAAGFVEIDRSRGREALTRLVEAKARLQRDGTSLWIAPEGTRSRDGQLSEFKRGGFQLAVVSGLPILPVTIDGSLRIHPSGSSRVERGVSVKVSVSPVVDPKAFGRKRLDALVEAVRSSIAGPLGQLHSSPFGSPNSGERSETGTGTGPDPLAAEG